MHGIDFSVLANGVIQVAVATAAIILPPLLAALLMWIFKRVGLVSAQQQAILQDQAEGALQRALSFAQSQGKIEVGKYLSNVTIADPTIAKAAAYTVAHWPDTFGKLGFDVTTPSGQQAIARMLTARLQPAAATAEAALNK